MDNPLWEWKDSDRLINSDTVDNTSIIKILEANSASELAEIEVDQNPHFINRPYSE